MISRKCLILPNVKRITPKCDPVYGYQRGSNRLYRNRHQQGFTLLEVMVALLIVALGLAAAVSTVTASVRNSAGLKERTFAHYVAMNELAKIEINGNRKPSKTEGTTEMAGHEWYWEMEFVKTADDTGKMLFVDIRVKANEDDENPVVTLRSMIGL